SMFSTWRTRVESCRPNCRRRCGKSLWRRARKMTLVHAPILSEAAAALCLFFILLVPSAAAGLALINSGLSRSRNAAHPMLSTLSILALAGLVYFAVGFAWQGYIGRPAHLLSINGKSWSWIGAERFFLRGIEFDQTPV